MSALSIQVPFPVFQDRDGQPLDNGYVWLGTSSLNPQTNPVVAYYDSALTIVATQPLRTLNGFISRAGSPAQVYVDAVNFSILVQDRQGTTVFSVPEGTGISPNASGVVYDPAGTGAVATTVQAVLRKVERTSGYSTFSAAVTAAAGKTLIVDSAVTTDTLTIGTTVDVEVIKGGGITVNSGQTLTINGTFDAPLFTVFAGTGSVVFGPGSTDEVVASWFGSTGAAIQKAVNASALYVKSVFVPSGTWLVSTEIQFPLNDATKDGIRVRGNKTEAAYSYDYPLAFSTIIQANAVMDSVFRGRGTLTATVPPEDYQTTKMHHYGSLEDMLILGNNQADYCYINGAQDTVRRVTFAGAKKSGVLLETFTNSSAFHQVLCVGNTENGAVLDGDYSTVSTWKECKFRGNGGAGAFIYSCIASSFNDCIFENNTGAGVYMYRAVATSLRQILNTAFNDCYWEQNDLLASGYQIRSDGIASAQNIVFNKPHINSGSSGRLGVLATRGDNIIFNDPLFTGDDTTLANWFSVGSAATNVRISGITEYQSTYFGFGGAGLANLFISGYKSTGALGTFFNKPLKASIITTAVTAATAKTLTDAEMCGTVISNSGQTANTYVDVPDPTEGFCFTVCVVTAGAFFWSFRAGTNKLAYRGLPKSQIYTATATLGDSLRFTSVQGVWLVEDIYGTWTSA